MVPVLSWFFGEMHRAAVLPLPEPMVFQSFPKAKALAWHCYELRLPVMLSTWSVNLSASRSALLSALWRM